MKHLRCHDNRFLYFHAFADQHALDTRNFFGRHFDSQVTAGDHDPVSDFEYLVDLVYAFLVFYLGDNLDRAVMFVQDTLDVHHVLLVTDEGVSDEIQIVLDRPEDILTVFFRQ